MKKYIYLDREKAKEGVSLVYKVSEEKVEDYKEYFEDKAVEFHGEDLPHFITYVEKTDSVREATEEEKLNNGHRELGKGEVLINGVIIYYDPYSQKIVDDKVIDKIRTDYINDGVITIESEKEKARTQREKEFDAYHKLINNYSAGVVFLSKENMEELVVWRAKWLDIPNNYTDLNISIEEMYPERLDRINYYYRGD